MDIEATFDPKVLKVRTASPSESVTRLPSQVSEMMRSLLRERFNLQIHFEEREIPIFALVLARADRALPTNIRPSKVDCSVSTAELKCGTRVNPDGTIVGTGGSLDEIVGLLEMRFETEGRPIRNLTGLDGRFDFTFRMSIPRKPDDEPILTILPKQLGLKLEGKRARERVLVIDHLE